MRGSSTKNKAGAKVNFIALGFDANLQRNSCNAYRLIGMRFWRKINF
jgi:hypothetical protein